ncbi:MAG: putative Ig domain-containing protein [Betaproteobacteria bacterium]|nr:putative Ig domain-containing protein [Betaproteobacteria bacterium]
MSFSAIGLPPGLLMSSSGLIRGTPTLAGTYSGIVTASNGTAPDATQSFTIVIQAKPAGCIGGGDSC